MKLTVFGFFLITAIFASPSLIANESSGLTEIYEQAIQSDPQIAAAKFGLEAGKEKSVQGLSLLLPQAQFSAGINYTKSSTDTPKSDNSSDSRNLALQLTQPLFNASNGASYDQSKIATKQSEIEYKLAEQDLILRVSQAYFDVLSAQENLAVAEAQTRALDESLARANLTFKVGTATKTDKLEAQARFDLARASQLSAENQLAIAKQILTSITGASSNKLKSLNKNAKLSSLQPTTMDEWVELAVTNSYQLKLGQFGVDISQHEVRKLKNDRLPTIDFVASASNSKQFLSFVGSDSTTTSLSAGVQLSVPLYTGGLMSSRIKEAEHQRAQQKELQTNTQRQIVLQTQQAFLSATNSFQQIEALKQALLSSESALQATQKGLEVGVRTNLDVLNAQQQFYSTERDYRIAKFNYLLLVLNLKATAGMLSATDIQALDALLTGA